MSRPWGPRIRGDRGAGGVLALAIVAATVVATLGALALSSALATRHRVSTAADAAALAAADVVLGVVPGDPCATASELARSHRATLVDCRIEGAHAYVTAEGGFAGIAVRASAHAGPPP